MTKPLIVALDFQDKITCLKLLKELRDHDEHPYVKVGLEMFINYGQEFIKELRALDFPVFLDLKLNDIPNTVEQTCRIISKWDVAYLTVHANGGAKMINAAKKGIKSNNNQTRLLAVTQLTSLSDAELKADFKMPINSQENVVNLARLAYQNGADGVISAAIENLEIKRNTTQNFLCINPGIRPTWSKINEQKRVVTPSEARKFDSDGIVVGRPITKSSDVLAAYQKIKGEWN